MRNSRSLPSSAARAAWNDGVQSSRMKRSPGSFWKGRTRYRARRKMDSTKATAMRSFASYRSMAPVPFEQEPRQTGPAAKSRCFATFLRRPALGECQRAQEPSESGQMVNASAASKPGRALLLEGRHALGVVGRLADDRHVRRDEVEVRTEIELEALVHEALDHPDRHLGAVRDLVSEGVGRLPQLGGRHDPVDDAQPQRLRCLDEVRGPQQLESLGGTDQARPE